MPNYGLQAGEARSKGILECYRKVCKRKLGSYSETGLRCNCGKLVKPAYQIAKNRVKLVGSHPGGMNLGAAGSSMTNLHSSSSDLGKYQQTMVQTYGTNPAVMASKEHLNGRADPRS